MCRLAYAQSGLPGDIALVCLSHLGMWCMFKLAHLWAHQWTASTRTLWPQVCDSWVRAACWWRRGSVSVEPRRLSVALRLHILGGQTTPCQSPAPVPRRENSRLAWPWRRYSKWPFRGSPGSGPLHAGRLSQPGSAPSHHSAIVQWCQL